MDVVALGEVRIAEIAAADQRAEDLVVAEVAVIFGQHVMRGAGLGGGEQRPALRQRDDGGDLAEDVDSGLEGLDRLRGVELLRRGDDDGIDLGEHLGVVSETGGDGVSGEDAFAQGGVQLAKGGDAGAGVGVQAGEVGQAALADDSNAKVMAHQDIYL